METPAFEDEMGAVASPPEVGEAGVASPPPSAVPEIVADGLPKSAIVELIHPLSRLNNG
jgi:hypothetical protein